MCTFKSWVLFFRLCFQLDAKILGLKKSRGSKLGLITQVESAAGLLNLRAICEHGILESRMFKFEALVFGSDDFLVSLGKPM